MVETKDNLAGQVFGRWLVLERAPDRVQPSGQRKVMWRCQCSCENKTIRDIFGYNLKGGHTSSCGCLTVENAKRLAQSNKENSMSSHAMTNISKEILHEYYKYHTRSETAGHFNITDSVLRKLLKMYDIKKTTDERRYTANKFIDMTGWVMSDHGVPGSRITVISFAGFFNGQTYWRCLCGCGNEWICNGANIREGSTLSCGCLHKERSSEHARELGYLYGGYNKKSNDYDLSNDFGIGYLSSGEIFYFDLEDYNIIKDFYWSNNNGYAVARICNDGDTEYVYMHRLVIDAKDSEVVDHINRNRLNNLKNNLRITDNLGNARNASLAKNNTSGFTGVVEDKKCNRWIAQITVNYKNKRLGIYQNKEDAIRARLQAEKQYFGEFSPQKHLYQEYGITNEILESRSDDTHDDSAAS